MDLSFIAAFKRYYMRRLISQAIRATDKEGGCTLKEFWKWYNIWNAVNTIGNSWAEMNVQRMVARRVCAQIWYSI
jgi:hypothetical protein